MEFHNRVFVCPGKEDTFTELRPEEPFPGQSGQCVIVTPENRLYDFTYQKDDDGHPVCRRAHSYNGIPINYYCQNLAPFLEYLKRSHCKCRQ